MSLHRSRPSAVGHQKRVVVDIFLNPPDPSASHAVLTGVGERDAVVLFAMGTVIGHLMQTAQADSEVGRHRFVIQEVVFTL